MRKTTDTLRRQWTLLQAISSHSIWHSTNYLHGRMRDEGYDVTIRTIQRDLDWLSAKFPLISEPRGKTLVWQWMKDAPGLEIPAMSQTTALVFQLAKQYLRPLIPANILSLLDPYFDRSAESLRNTQLADWNNKVMHIETGPQLAPPEIDSQVRDAVYGALLEGKRFTADYTRRYKTKTATYEVNPLGIVTREGVTYLVCTLWDYTDIRQLAVHRISTAAPLDVDATNFPDFSLEKYVRKEAAFGYPESRKTIRLRALFDEGAAFHLSERKLSEDQKLKELRNGNYSLTATVANTAELRWWLLGFGDGVEVIAPKALREEFRKVAGSMAQIYS